MSTRLSAIQDGHQVVGPLLSLPFLLAIARMHASWSTSTHLNEQA